MDKIQSHIQELKNHLLTQFSTDPNFNRLYEIFGTYSQEIEDALYKIYSFTLNNSVGKRLELEGLNSGYPRPLQGIASTDDDAYRALIKAFIVVTFSNGIYDDVYALLEFLGAEEIKASQIPESGYLKLEIKGNLLIPITEIIETLKQATAPVTIQLVRFYSYPFGFTGNINARGFGVGKLGDFVKT